jgi:AraC family transcriptional regulator
MTQQFSSNDVSLRDLPDISVAFMSHRGDPQRLGETIRRFIAWRKGQGPPRRSRHLHHFSLDPDVGGPDACHIDLATEIRRPLTAADEGVEAGLIPGGRCAVLRVIGHSDDLRPAAEFLYGDWLPASGEDLRDMPLYAQRVRFFPDVPEHEAITDIFLPLR